MNPRTITVNKNPAYRLPPPDGRPPDGYPEYYEHGPYGGLYEHEHRTAGLTPVRLLVFSHPAGRYADPPLSDLVVFVLLRGMLDGRFDLGAGRFRARTRPGRLILGAPDVANTFDLDDPHEVLAVCLPPSLVADLAEDATGLAASGFGRLHAGPFYDPVADGVCRRLWDEAAAGNPRGNLFADGAIRVLVAALLRGKDAGAPRRPAHACGGLAPWRLRRALAYLEDHLAEDVTLAELAAAAELSRSHFARAFRAETGVSPYRHLQERRVARAKELLAAGNLPLAAVAVAVGFKSQEHFTAVFRRLTGSTPGRYRVDRRG